MEQTKIMNKNISISETNSTNWLNRDDQFDNKQTNKMWKRNTRGKQDSEINLTNIY